jgi:hypothetical protein
MAGYMTAIFRVGKPQCLIVREFLIQYVVET